MATLPSQLLISLLLGLLVASALLLAGYLIYRAFKPRVLVVRPRSDGSSANLALERTVARRERRRKAAILSGAALIVFGSLAGKYVVAAFYPQGDAPSQGDARTSTVKGASGSELAVVRMGGGNGPTLVMTHGWGADSGDWSYAVRHLPPEFNVVLWDLPGLGESTAIGDYAISNLAADLDRVVASAGGKPVILVGHSVGGILNIEYARRFPAKMGREVIGLVQANTTYTNPLATKKNGERSLALQKPVFEPMLHFVTWTSPVARAFGWLAYRSGLAHLQLAAQSFAGSQTWTQLDHMASYAYRSSPSVVARGVLSMLQWDGTDALGKIAVPTLVIAGDRDTTTLPSASDRMAREIPSAERLTIGHAAHLGPVEQSERYAAAIAAFAHQASGTTAKKVAVTR